jgi:DNA-binding response OmpR family regulator
METMTTGGQGHQTSTATPDVDRFACRRVLLADGSASLRQAIGTALRADGYEVVEATDGLELIEHLVEFPATAAIVIVAAIPLATLTGMDVLAVLRCVSRMTPVILLAETDDADADAEARDLGAAIVLHQPVDIGHLRSLVGRAMTSGVGEGGKR